MNIPYVMRKCTVCGEWKVASTVNFHRSNKHGRYGLASQCKKCRNKKNKQYRKANRDKILEYYKTNKEKIAKKGKQYRENNKDKIAKKNKRYYEKNKDRKAEYNKQYRENNKERIAEQKKQYYETNKDKISEQHKRYRQSPQGQAVEFNSKQRRRTKEEQQGTGITTDQWLELMSFFDWRCAYSGEYLGGNDNSFNRTIDHIVPLNSNGDNMIWNCVPMLRSLNSSTSTKDMEEWYREQSFYSEARLQKIYDWQEYAYNKYGKDSEYFNTNDIQIKLL